MSPNDLILLISVPRFFFIHHILVLDAGSHIFTLLRTVTLLDIFGFFTSTPHLYYLTTHAFLSLLSHVVFTPRNRLALCIVGVSGVMPRAMRTYVQDYDKPSGLLVPRASDCQRRIITGLPNAVAVELPLRLPIGGCSTNPQKCYESS